MASSKPVPCGPCKQDKVNTEADIWCNNCDEGLCSSCASHHKRIKSSRDHKTIDIQTYTRYKPPTVLIKTECDAHSQQFNLYCPNHLIPCCDECVSTSHSKCTGIKSLASVVEKTKTKKWQESVEKGLISLTNFLDEMAKKKLENIRRGEKQYESIKKSVSQIRNEINKHLDNLEEKLYKEADTVWGQEKSKLTRLITEIEEKTKNLREMLDYLKTVTERNSKLQSFLGVNLIEQKVHQCHRYVDDIEDSERVCDVNIKIMQNGKIEKILKELKSVDVFGDVNVIKTEISLKRKTSVSREAQLELKKQSNIDNMKMNIETRIPLTIGKQINDIICLMDGRFVVAELEGKVYLLTSDGKLEKQLPVPTGAWGVSQINKDTIVITYPFEIKIFNMQKETVTKVITPNKQCFGLTFSNNSLAVGLGKDEIRIIDLEGNTTKSIQVQSKSNLYNIVYCNDRVTYSDFRGKAVYCVDESGKQVWQHKHDLSGPRGLCADTYDNIIVADPGSKRIIVISKDGQDNKVLVGKDDLGYSPWCICFNKLKKSYGFICDFDGKDITRFNLAYD